MIRRAWVAGVALAAACAPLSDGDRYRCEAVPDRCYQELVAEGWRVDNYTRRGALDGDGLPAASAVGFFPGVENRIQNGSMEGNTFAFRGFGTAAEVGLTRDQFLFGVQSLLVTLPGGGHVATDALSLDSGRHFFQAWVYPTGTSWDLWLDTGEGSVRQIHKGVQSGMWSEVTFAVEVSASDPPVSLRFGSVQPMQFAIDGVRFYRAEDPVPFQQEGTASTSSASLARALVPDGVLGADAGSVVARVRPSWHSTGADREFGIGALGRSGDSIELLLRRSSGAFFFVARSPDGEATQPIAADRPALTAEVRWESNRLWVAVGGVSGAPAPRTERPAGEWFEYLNLGSLGTADSSLNGYIETFAAVPGQYSSALAEEVAGGTERNPADSNFPQSIAWHANDYGIYLDALTSP